MQRGAVLVQMAAVPHEPIERQAAEGWCWRMTAEFQWRTWSIRKGPNQNHMEAYSHTVLSHADLEQPSCPACYRPGAAAGYCRNCVDTGSATRHEINRRRGL
jgi:hypothetical protein